MCIIAAGYTAKTNSGQVWRQSEGLKDEFWVWAWTKAKSAGEGNAADLIEGIQYFCMTDDGVVFAVCVPLLSCVFYIQ